MPVCVHNLFLCILHYRTVEPPGNAPSCWNTFNRKCSSVSLVEPDAWEIYATKSQRPARTRVLSIEPDLKRRHNFRLRLKTPTGSGIQRLT